MAARRLPPSWIDQRRPRHVWMGALVAGLGLCGLTLIEPAARTAEPEPKPEAGPPAQFLVQHCQGCHAGDKPKGKFRLDSLTQDFHDKASRERWLAALEQVKSGAM